MNPLLRHVSHHAVVAHDALKIARGGTWRDLWLRNVLGGACTHEVRFTANAKAITITRSPDGPGVVTWAEVAELIRAGLDDDLVADLRSALADWNTYNHDPAGRGDLTHDSCTGRMREVERRVVDNALAPAAVQLDLFGVTA